MLYVPLEVLAAGFIPLASMLNGPVVNGVTLVLVVAVAACQTYHCQCVQVTTVLFEATVTDGSFCIYWIVYYNCRCSGITICWAYIQSC
jgi:hypothetical protein